MIQPRQSPKLSTPAYGFNDYVERINGRAAMIGLVVAIAVEVATGNGILSLLGLH
ncbi:MAG TPA: hypothetical protein V6D19_19250 [Stenomitos sp.]